MRPIAFTQSSRRFPLNQLFGAESHVRILRVLTEPGQPLSATDIAVRAGLTAPGARKALANLVRTGLVERTGSGKQQQYALRRNEPLANEVLQLFDSERRRFVGQPTSEPRVLQQNRPDQNLECGATEFSEALAKLIERDPSLIKRARLHVLQISEKDPGSADRDLAEWRDILETYPPERLAHFLTSTSEESKRLNSCSPFPAILSNNEREYLLAASRADA